MKHKIKKHMKKLTAGFFISVIFMICLILTGCGSVGPDFTWLDPSGPKTWHTDPEGGLTYDNPSPETLANWWKTLNDPDLEFLIKSAVKNNLNLKHAAAKVREARALKGISRAGLFPAVDAKGSVSKIRTGEGRGQHASENDLYYAGFDAAWELDIFGGTRRAIEAASANLQASKEYLHYVLVSLAAEVSLNYVEVRTYQARLALAKANIKTQEKTYALNISRYRAGIINELPVRQSLYVLEHTKSLIPSLEIGLEKAKNRLAVLVGKNPGHLEPLLAKQKPIPVPPLTVAVGIPAETLRHRPDVRRAEWKLAAATAEIGVATAELYPKFRLFGTIGLESVSSGDFMDWSSRVWTIGPDISWNIFRGGAIRQKIKVQTARQEQAMILYESTVLHALEEVENALTAYGKEQQKMTSLKAAVKAARHAYNLALDQYRAGLVDFSNVLDAQRAMQSFQDELAFSEGTVTSNLVRLYKALGGGWKHIKPNLMGG